MECVTESKIKDRVNQTAMNHGCSDGIPWGYVCLLVRLTRSWFGCSERMAAT